MKTTFVAPTSNLVPENVYTKILSDVETALNSLQTMDGKFIVNDTIWRKKPTKNNRDTMNPVVVNQADFITSGLETYLEKHLGWRAQKSITLSDAEGGAKQTFDAYKDFRDVKGCKLIGIEEEGVILRDFLDKQGAQHFADFARDLRNYYRNRSCFGLDPKLGAYATKFSSTKGSSLRVAIEIETGNIASSFRSIYKMSALFSAGAIDVGILITSTKKKGGATSIWPVSNRNGSLEELNNRRAFANLDFPLILVGFMPDGLHKDAPYLSGDGTTYTIESIAKVTLNGVSYRKGTTPIHGEIYTEL
jgi:hypothetical protein